MPPSSAPEPSASAPVIDPFAPPRAPAELDASSGAAVDGVLPPRSGVLRALQATVAVAAFGILGEIHLMLVINQTNPSMSSLERADMVTMVTAISALLVLVATVVAWGRWVHRAATNLRALVPDGIFEFTPASQVWWYFVPFANLFKPARGTREIWSYSMMETGRDDADPSIINKWWGFWIASNIASNVAFRITPNPESASSTASYFQQLTIAGGVSILGDALAILAALFALSMIRSINEAQRSVLS